MGNFIVIAEKKISSDLIRINRDPRDLDRNGLKASSLRKMGTNAPPNQPMPINSRNVMHNTKSLNFSRTSLSVLSGVVAGILGLSPLLGFLFYFLASGFLGLYYLAQKATTDAVHFLNKQQLVTGFVFENLFTYILMWTLIYGCVHVY